jgi:hypothetical protein
MNDEIRVSDVQQLVDLAAKGEYFDTFEEPVLIAVAKDWLRLRDRTGSLASAWGGRDELEVDQPFPPAGGV